MLHSDYVSFEEPATSDSARLPPHLQRTILDFFFSSLRDLGGAVSIHRRKLLSPIQLVNSRWNSYTKHQFEIYPYFDFREPEIDYEEIDDCLRNRKLMRCICHGEGILSISFNNSEEKSLAGRKKCWKKTLERVVKQFSHLEQLNLWLADDGCGENHELAYRFPHLRKLYISSTCHINAASLFVTPDPPLHTFASSLVRLDLDAVFLDYWYPDVPSLTTLSLTHVEFGIDQENLEDRFDTARDFFLSFPKLRSIAFNGLDHLNSDALAFLPIFTLRSLYLGKCSFADSKCHCKPHQSKTSSGAISTTFVDCLARHFRSKIRHLILDPNAPSSLRLAENLASRPDRPFPPYLAKLESIRIASAPEISNTLCYEGANSEEENEEESTSQRTEEREYEPFTFAGKAEEKKRVKTMLEEAGLQGVEIRWWRAGETEACTAWDPEEVRYED